MTKIKIDLNTGFIEVEGDDEFVKSVYQDYKENILSGLIMNGIKTKEINPTNIENSKNIKTGKTTNKKNGKRKESYSIAKDLDLSGKSGKLSLKEFYAKENPRNALERNGVFVYYLEKIREIDKIGLSHIYTCYKEIPGIKIPGALKQSLLDTSSIKGWVDTSSMENIKITTLGENLVEIDLLAERAEPKI